MGKMLEFIIGVIIGYVFRDVIKQLVKIAKKELKRLSEN